MSVALDPVQWANPSPKANPGIVLVENSWREWRGAADAKRLVV
jgi:hypothetical protein